MPSKNREAILHYLKLGCHPWHPHVGTKGKRAAVYGAGWLVPSCTITSGEQAPAYR